MCPVSFDIGRRAVLMGNFLPKRRTWRNDNLLQENYES